MSNSDDTPTVDDIVATIERTLRKRHLELSDSFSVTTGRLHTDQAVQRHADHVTVSYRRPKGFAVRLTAEERAEVVRALRATAAFRSWSQAADAAAILRASGLDEGR